MEEGEKEEVREKGRERRDEKATKYGGVWRKE